MSEETQPFEYESEDEINEEVVEHAAQDNDHQDDIDCASQLSFHSNTSNLRDNQDDIRLGQFALDRYGDRNSDYRESYSSVNDLRDSSQMSVKVNMKKYVNSNKKKFQRQFSIASLHLEQQGVGQSILEYDSTSQNSVIRFLWSERGAN